jgi:hypothetical protein
VQPAEECWDGMTQKDASFIQDKVVTLKNGQKVLAPMLQKHAGNVRQFLNDVAIPTTEADNLLEKVASMPIETVDLFCRIYGDTLSKPSEG